MQLRSSIRLKVAVRVQRRAQFVATELACQIQRGEITAAEACAKFEKQFDRITRLWRWVGLL